VLGPILADIGGPGAAVVAFEAIGDVQRWWP